MCKAIFIDIDGTLRNSKRELTNKTIETIKRATEHGIIIVLCSGRPRKYTEIVSKECFASQYIITSGGGSIYDYKNKKILYKNIMNKQACKELYGIAEKVNARFLMDVGECRVVNRIEHFDGSEIQLNEEIYSFIDNNDIMQCTIADKDFDKIKNIGDEIRAIKNVEIKNQHKSLTNRDYPKEGTIYYDVANIESNKGHAIKEFCRIFNIKNNNTIAIGDGLNDLDMFETVGYSVAVKNAHEMVKKVADEVTDTNDNNGVALFIEKLLKSRKEGLKYGK